MCGNLLRTFVGIAEVVKNDVNLLGGELFGCSFVSALGERLHKFCTGSCDMEYDSHLKASIEPLVCLWFTLTYTAGRLCPFILRKRSSAKTSVMPEMKSRTARRRG